MLGEAGELAAAVQADIDELFHLRLLKKSKKLLRSLSGETDRAKENIHKSKVLDGLGGRAESELLGLAAERVLESHIAFGNKERAAIKGGQVVQFEQAI